MSGPDTLASPAQAMPARDLSVLARVRNGLEWVTKTANVVAAILVVMMMLLTTVDVVGRYLFNQPIIGSFELTEFMMAGMVFLGLAHTQVNKGHVSVSVLVDRLSPRVRLAIGLATTLLSLGFLALMVQQSFYQAQAYLKREVLSAVLELPIVPFFSVAILGTLLLGLVVLTDLLGDVRSVKIRRDRWLLLLPGMLIFLLLVAAMVWQPSLPQVGLTVTGLLGIGLLILLIFSGIPIAYALALGGFLGIVYMLGTTPGFEVLTKRPYLTAASYTLSVVPLFVLMGYLCLYFEIGKDVYSSLNKWMGHMPGGLAMATVGGCAAFAAVTGASIACAVAIGVVAIPEMMRYKYAPTLATGVVAAGGTLGILIPPSITFVVYGVLTEQSISKLFIAGILPGIMLALMMMAYIFIHARFRPEIAPAGVGPVISLREKMLSLRHTLPVLALFLLVIGGLYAGVFSPTEGGGIGAMSALVIGLAMGRFTWKRLTQALLKTIDTTTMIMFLFIGAEFLSVFFAQSRLPFMMSEWAASLSVPPFVVITFFLLIFLALGCIMPTLPVVVLLTPIIFPTVTALGFDPIWFGVLVVIMVEIGLITPPVGANVYAIAGVAKDVPMETIFKGIMPFLGVMVLGVILLMMFPQIALFLPSLMK